MSDPTDERAWAPIRHDTAAKFDELRKQWRESVDQQRLPEAGQVIDRRFRVVRELGKGGFGCVFEVEHLYLNQRFALKLLIPEVAAQPGWSERFQEEARTTAQLGHPNIVFITDFGHCEGFGPYFVMEYLEGESLRQILDERRLPNREALALAKDMASALDAAHSRHIVHCDLKPQNVFRVETGWKLLDFGTSSIVMSAWQTQTLYGTPKYMAPEHAMGDVVDERADIFSMGILLYEALTQSVPWETRAWLHATPRWRSEHPPAPPSTREPKVPKRWDVAILRAMSIDPEERFYSMGEFVEELENALESRPPTLPRARGLRPDTVIRPSGGTAVRRSVTPGEFFVMSRIGDGISIAELHRLCTGLPFNLVQTVESMIERGYITPEDEGTRHDARNPVTPPRADATDSWATIAETTEISEPLDLTYITARIEELRQRGNVLGALETIRAAVVTWPEIALLHFWHGTLLRDLGREPVLARQAFEQAAALEPGNQLFSDALELLEDEDG